MYEGSEQVLINNDGFEYGRVQQGGTLHLLQRSERPTLGTLPPALCGRRMGYLTVFWEATPEECREIVWCGPCRHARAKEEEKR